VQSDLNVLSIWSDDAAQQLKIAVDTEVLDGIVNQCAATNRGATAGKYANLNLGIKGTPITVVGQGATAGQSNLIDLLLRMGECLDEQNIPEVGRWVVMPAWAGRQIKQSELRQAYLSGDPVSMLRNGRLGMIDRFTLYISNLLPTNASDSTNFAAGEFPIFAGHAHGITFASQISKLETLRSELTFGQILRGLQVYGYQVIDGTALCQAQVISGG
jgi:hypothetical protein